LKQANKETNTMAAAEDTGQYDILGKEKSKSLDTNTYVWFHWDFN